MKALEMLYRDKKWIEECDISKIPIEKVQTTIKDLVEINEAISELEALQQPKSCDGCIRLPFILIELAKRDGGKCGTCKRFVKDHYELAPKEQ